MLLITWLFVTLAAFDAERVPMSHDAHYPVVDVSNIPVDTVNVSDGPFTIDNGIVYRGTVPYSGVLREAFPDGGDWRVASYLNGMQHGLTSTYYANGQLRDVRSYQNNTGYGRHFGYWENGTMKFDFFYLNDRREGIQQQWYESGKPYAFLTFHNDREAGMQQAWRESGRLYINYEVRDNIRYGLQKSALCSEVENGEVL